MRRVQVNRDYAHLQIANGDDVIATSAGSELINILDAVEVRNLADSRREGAPWMPNAVKR